MTLSSRMGLESGAQLEYTAGTTNSREAWLILITPRPISRPNKPNYHIESRTCWPAWYH